MDEDIISLEVPRSAEEAKQSMHFKDSMRDHSLTGARSVREGGSGDSGILEGEV